MATLNVGAGQAYATLSAAVSASHDGDTIAVQAGTYVNDFATVDTKLSIVGVGGMANFVAERLQGEASVLDLPARFVDFAARGTGVGEQRDHHDEDQQAERQRDHQFHQREADLSPRRDHPRQSNRKHDPGLALGRWLCEERAHGSSVPMVTTVLTARRSVSSP